MKRNALNQPPHPSPQAATPLAEGSADGFPPEIMALAAMPPAELACQLRPNVRPARVAAIFAAMGCDTGHEVPEWAKVAAAKFLEAAGLDFFGRLEADTPADVGKMIGAFEAAKPDESNPLVNAIRVYAQSAKSKAANASAGESKQFFDGRAAGSMLLERCKGLAHRTKIFMAIAIFWPEIGELKSSGELHRFLLETRGDHGKPIFAVSTDSREIRKVCKIIGLRYPNAGGRPKF